MNEKKNALKKLFSVESLDERNAEAINDGRKLYESITREAERIELAKNAKILQDEADNKNINDIVNRIAKDMADEQEMANLNQSPVKRKVKKESKEIEEK